MPLPTLRSLFHRVTHAVAPAPLPSVQPLEPRHLLSATAVSDVRVMTQNLSYGAGTGLDLFAGAVNGDLWQHVQQTDFPSRAAAIAKEVAAAQPDLIGLQEATIWRTGPLLGDATHLEYDFTQILIGALAARGLTYRAVATSTNADLSFPADVDGDLKTLRMTDQDVILARFKRGSRFAVLTTSHGNYDATFHLNVPVLGDEPFTRGWAAVDVRAGAAGRPFRFVTTHLDAFDSAVRDAQAQELLAGPASSLKVPVLVAGDFNAIPGSALFTDMTHAGFADAWPALHGSAPGYTGTQSDTLDNPTSQLSERIDAVFLRGSRTGVLAADTIGDTPADKTPAGLWPSDHAGVTATISLNRPRRRH